MIMSTIYDYNRSTKVLESVILKFTELKNFSIPIIFTDEIPFKLNEFIEKGLDYNKDFKYPIFQLFGEYIPKNNIIKIYLQGLNFAFRNSALDKKLMKEYQMLLKIVILHEIGHFWFYNNTGLPLKIKNDLIVELETSDNNQSDRKYIYEWVAQIFAYLCLETDEERDFMKKLSSNQPEEYQTYLDDIKNITLNKFKQFCKFLHLNDFFTLIGSDKDFFSIEEKHLTNDDKFKITPLENKIKRFIQFVSQVELGNLSLDFDNILANTNFLDSIKMIKNSKPFNI